MIITSLWFFTGFSCFKPVYDFFVALFKGHLLFFLHICYTKIGKQKKKGLGPEPTKNFCPNFQAYIMCIFAKKGDEGLINVENFI